MNLNFQKNGFLNNGSVNNINIKFNSIRKTPEQIKEEMIKLRSASVSNIPDNKLKKMNNIEKNVNDVNYRNRINAINNIRRNNGGN